MSDKENDSPPIRGSDGKITRYGFLCGYVEYFEVKHEQGRRSCIISMEGGVQHLDVKYVDMDNRSKDIWLQTRKVSVAYKWFNQMKSHIISESKMRTLRDIAKEQEL